LPKNITHQLISIGWVPAGCKPGDQVLQSLPELVRVKAWGAHAFHVSLYYLIISNVTLACTSEEPRRLLGFRQSNQPQE
jgi:hypothetical protein